MNKNVWVGILTALLGLVGLIFLMAAESHFPIVQWPYQAFQGLVFSFVWGFGVSAVVGHIYASFVVITVAIVSFAIGHKIARIFSK
ncbi:hypothetical protein [Vibrio sp. TBV020]|uniref:hypothetical protein n=1 Tax=Vibrio sp. TBV020 TaxID=3137398 RepID=UPI0038CD7D5F